MENMNHIYIITFILFIIYIFKHNTNCSRPYKHLDKHLDNNNRVKVPLQLNRNPVTYNIHIINTDSLIDDNESNSYLEELYQPNNYVYNYKKDLINNIDLIDRHYKLPDSIKNTSISNIMNTNSNILNPIYNSCSLNKYIYH